MIELSSQIDAIATVALNAGIPLAQVCSLVESRIVAAATARTNGNITAAAVLLGIHRNTLHNKLRAKNSELLAGMKRERSSLRHRVVKLSKAINSQGPARRRRG